MKTFFLGMKHELLLIQETREGFTYTSYLKGTHPTRLAFDPQNENRIYCSTNGDGLFKSEDGGRSWVTIGTEAITSSRITAVAVDPIKKVNGNSVVYAGTEPSRLYYSEDNGGTWREFLGIQTLPSKTNWRFPPRPESHFVRWITPSFTNENHIGVSIEAGAFIRTEDYGKTWKDRPEESPIDIHTLLAHPQAPSRLYAANGDGSSNHNRAYAESTDEGQTWTYLSEGVEEHPYLYHMVLNPANPDDRLVSGSKNASHAHSRKYSTVYRKTGNTPWKEVSEGLPKEGAFTHTLAADPSETNVFYAMNNFGVFRLDAGESRWHKLELDWKEEYIDQQPTCFYAVQR